MNEIKAKHGSVGAVTVSDMIKEFHSAPQGIKSVIKSKYPKSQKKSLGPLVPNNNVRPEADE